MDNANRLFRKAAFGGFNKDDVIDYIEKMKLDFFEYRTQVEDTIKELNEKIASFESMDYVLQNILNDDKSAKADSTSHESDDGSDAISYINEATSHLKRVADELCDNLNQFMSKLNDSSIFSAPASAGKQEASKPEPSQTAPASGDSAISFALDSLLENIQNDKPEKKEPQKSDNGIVKSVLPKYLLDD